MNLPEIPGLESFKNINFNSLLTGVGALLVALLVLCVVTGVVIFFLYKAKEKKAYNKQLFLFEEIHGDIVPTETLLATELTIPGTNIQVFYSKAKDLYLPRGVRKMGKDKYWYVLRSNGELINVSLKNINKEMKELNLDYDHTDMRYAHSNLKDLIKRNYKDKNIKWWKEYKEVISLVIFVFILTLAFGFIVWRMGALVDKITQGIGLMQDILKALATLDQSSGIKGVLT